MSEIDIVDQFMNQASEAHSFQDAAIYGVLAALMLFGGGKVLPIIAALLGIGGAQAGGWAMLRNTSEELLRMDDIRDAPEYAILGFAVTFAVTTALIILGQAVGLGL